MTDDMPDGLLDAFWRYDRALLANDQDTLGELFMPGPDTLRGDGQRVLVGHDAITGFRAGRAVIPTRRIERVHSSVITEDAVLLMARTRDGEATGLQSQLWRRIDGRWVVAAAHVSLPAKSAPATPTTPTPTPATPTTPTPTTPTPATPPVPAASSAPSAMAGSSVSSAPPFDRTVWRVVGDPLAPPRASGVLDGLGVAVKDLFAVAGHTVGAGVPAWSVGQQRRAKHAPAVAALLDVGAHVVGIARTDELAYSLSGANTHYGTPPNPAVPEGVSGGSSSGPASAVALGQAAIGLGTDTAGSIRVPASYQGLVGLRTTHRAVPTQDVQPLAPAFDVVGWLTRDLRTAALVAGVLLPARDQRAPIGRTLRLPTVEALARADISAAFSATVDKSSALPTADRVDLSTSTLERWFTAFRTTQAFQAWQAHGKWINAHPGELGAEVAERFRIASRIGATEAATARDVVRQARETIHGWLADSVLVIPSAATPAPARASTAEQIEAARASTLRMTCLASIAGTPALSVPLLCSAEGHPVGLCLIGAPGTDHDLLDLAARMGVA